MIKSLSKRNQLLVGFTLFSMFFGAGNLIFPPQLGAQAGTATWPAMAGLAISAVGLPILAVIAVVRAGSLDKLASRVHPVFSLVFTILIYLSIGPCLAIPRTASTSFEMAVPPFLPEGASTTLLQLGYSAVFFAAAFLVALRPEKLTSRLGKVLCPTLLVLVTVIFLGCLVHPLGGYGAVQAPYDHAAPVQGFLTGYQTMDAIAGLNFGIVIVLNIKALGLQETKSVERATVRAGVVAAVLFLVMYSMLAHVGAVSGGAFPGTTNGAVTLTNLVRAIFGAPGSVLLAAVFIIACFNTCVGLISCCSSYFNTLIPKIPVPAWAAFFALVSMFIANAGLDQILAISVPVLNMLYPAAIVLIVLAFLPAPVQRLKGIYPWGIAFVGVASVAYEVRSLGQTIPALDRVLSRIPLSGAVDHLLEQIPLAGVGLGWVMPAVVGILLGAVISLMAGQKDQAEK